MTELNEISRRPVAVWQHKASVSADDVPALKAVYAAHAGVVHRIETAAQAGEICELLASAYCNRAIRAVQRAVRGQMPAAEAALEVAQAEFEAMGRAPLAPEDRSIKPAVFWVDVMRSRSQPVDALGAPDAA